MDLIKKRGRPPGAKNNLSLKDKAETVFNKVYKNLDEDLTKITPRERIAACVSLAGHFLNNQTK